MFPSGLLVVALLSWSPALSTSQSTSSTSPPPQQVPTATLKAVVILARHGIRSPKQTFPDDASASRWTNWGGPDKLTNFGIVQELEFGRFLKSYYEPFFGTDYQPEQIYARYSHCANTFLSTLCVLNGLFGANNSHAVVDSIRCRDDFVFYPEEICEKLSHFKEEKLKSSEYIKMNEEKKDLVLNLSTLSGVEMSEYIHLNLIADTVISMIANNVSIPKWSVEYKYDILFAKDYYFRFYYGDKEIAKLVAGPILHEIKQSILKKVHDNSTQKISLYMTQDTYLCSLLTLLNIKCEIQPNYASAILFELWEDAERNQLLKILYKNNFPSQDIFMELIELEGCDEFCPLATFLDLTKGFEVDNILKECELDDGGVKILVLKLVCYTTFFVLLVLAIITTVFRRRFARNL